jgi:predicted transcriptional regulator
MAAREQIRRQRHALTREGLQDVDAGRLIEHTEVAAWAASLAPKKIPDQTQRRKEGKGRKKG